MMFHLHADIKMDIKWIFPMNWRIGIVSELVGRLVWFWRGTPGVNREAVPQCAECTCRQSQLTSTCSLMTGQDTALDRSTCRESVNHSSGPH